MSISGVYLLNRAHACRVCVCEKTPKMLSLYVSNCARARVRACGRVRARKLESEWRAMMSVEVGRMGLPERLKGARNPHNTALDRHENISQLVYGCVSTN
jgi:hypothetical protein